MFGINISIQDNDVNLESEKNLKEQEQFVFGLQTKKEYPTVLLKKYLKKELGIGETRSFEKEVLASFEGDELDEKYEWLHSLRV